MTNADPAYFNKLNLAKQSFLYFCQAVLKMEIAPHHIEWAQLMEQHPRLLIEAARGHGKSWFISKAYVLWRAFRGKPWEILLVSFSEEQATDLMRKIQQEVESNPLLVDLRPQNDTVWQTTLFTFPGPVKVKAIGFGSSVRGQHPDEILVDDPLKDKGAMDPVEQYDYFMGALSGTAKRNTKIIVIGTPLDPGDLLERLESNEVYKFKAYPAESAGKPLFPYLFDSKDLDFIKREKGSLVYAREYLLQRIDPGTQIFNDKYLTINKEIQFPPFVAVRTLIDPAISEKDEACDTAIVTVGIDERNKFWELDTRLIKSDNVSAMLREMVKCCEIFRQYPDYAVVMEAELFQRVLAFKFRELCNERGLDTRCIEVTHTGTLGKHQRIQGLQPAWEARAIILLPESELIKQFREYRPKARNIRVDGVDAFSWIKDERVSVPYISAQPIYGEVPDSEYEI